MKNISFLVTVLLATQAFGQNVATIIDAKAQEILPKVIEWRRHIHQHPELGNRETKTAALVASHLRKLGIEVKEGVAKTGVVGTLKGNFPGPCIAL